MGSERVAVIVGGGGGIGQAIAREYFSAGHTLVLVDRDADRLRTAAEGLSGARVIAADITRAEDVERVATEIESVFERVEVLVHAAGLTQVSLARATEMDVYRRVMEVNFFGVIALTRRLLARVILARGEIVVLSSICGFAPLVARTGYCASKHALHGYFETLRWEVAPHGVGVLIVCPSFAATDFAARGLAGDGQVLPFERSTLGRAMTPAAIARQVKRAADRRRGLLVLSWRGRLSYWLTRFFPSLYGRLMARSFAVELRRE